MLTSLCKELVRMGHVAGNHELLLLFELGSTYTCSRYQAGCDDVCSGDMAAMLIIGKATHLGSPAYAHISSSIKKATTVTKKQQY